MFAGWMIAVRSSAATAGRGAGVWVARACGGVLPALLPPLHMVVLATYWSDYTRPVDHTACTCGCWDTVFKGTYETGLASYKHMYFNATRNTLFMWLVTVFAVLSLYESVRYLVVLALERRLRYSMALLFTSVLFSHYYSWWSYVNYWNDDFYSQWGHQLFFSITEIVSTAAVLRLADSRTEFTSNGVLPIVGVAAVHILAAGKDQFVENVIVGQGSAHQVVRDLALMLPDLLHMSVPLMTICCSRKTPLAWSLRERREFILRTLFVIVVGLTLYSFL